MKKNVLLVEMGKSEILRHHFKKNNMKLCVVLLSAFLIVSCSPSKDRYCIPVFELNDNISVREVLKLGKSPGIDVNVYQTTCGDTIISYYLSTDNTRIECQGWEFRILTDAKFDDFFDRNGIYFVNTDGNRGVTLSKLKNYSSKQIIVHSDKTKCYYTLAIDTINEGGAAIYIYYEYPQ